MEGGLILLKLEKQNNNVNKDDFSCDLILEYNDINNKKYEQKYSYKVEKGDYQGLFLALKEMNMEWHYTIILICVLKY